MRHLSLFAAVFGLLVTAGTANAQWGDLKGRFVFDGPVPPRKQIDTPNVKTKEPIYDSSLIVDEKTKGLQNVVIYVYTRGVKVHPDYEKTANDKLLFDNKDFRFQPHVLTMRLSQTLVLGNSDAVAHNSNFQPLGDEPINPLIPPGKNVEYKANRAQIIPQPVGCNIHPWMQGHILVRADPYATVSKEDGSFELKNLPAGELEFQFWHEKRGFLFFIKRKEDGKNKVASDFLTDESPEVIKAVKSAAGALPGEMDFSRGRVKLKIKAGTTDVGEIKLAPILFDK